MKQKKNTKEISMDDNIKQFAAKLRALLIEHRVSLGVDLDGDTHGITSEDFVVIDNATDERTVLNCCSSYLGSSDIELV